MDDPALHNAWARNNRAISIYKRHKSEKRRWPMEIITFIGPTGTGKTRQAYHLYPDIFEAPDKKGSGMYFDGYDDHKQILIDEMYGNKFSHGALLTFCDRYPHMLAVHGGFVNMNADVIVFTSNKHPSLWYNQEKFPWEGGPLQRRMTTNGSRIYQYYDGAEPDVVEGVEPVVDTCAPE